MATSSSVSPTTKSLLSQGSKELPWENPSNLLSILKSFLFLAGEAHLALLSAQWGMGMREKGAKNGLLSELKSFILWSWTVLSFWISSSLPFSTIVDCKTACCSAVPPNPIGSGGHIRRQERSICSDWTGTSHCHLVQSLILFTFSPAHSIWPHESDILNFFSGSFFDLLLLFQSLLEHTVF